MGGLGVTESEKEANRAAKSKSKVKDNEGLASDAGGRKESEKITRAVQAKQAAEKRAKR